MFPFKLLPEFLNVTSTRSTWFNLIRLLKGYPEWTKTKPIISPKKNTKSTRGTIAFAAMTGWDEQVIQKTTQRCETLFRERMSFAFGMSSTADNMTSAKQDNAMSKEEEMLEICSPAMRFAALLAFATLAHTASAHCTMLTEPRRQEH